MCERDTHTHTYMHKNFTVSEKAISLQEIEVWDGRDVVTCNEKYQSTNNTSVGMSVL